MATSFLRKVKEYGIITSYTEKVFFIYRVGSYWSSNIYDSITASVALCDPTNISLHNAVIFYCLCQVLDVNLLFLLILACIHVQVNDVTGRRLQMLNAQFSHGIVSI